MMTDIVERLRAATDYLSQHINIMGQAANEIERLRKLTEWQPIETAPKDGASILVCDDRKTALAWFELSGKTGMFTELLIWNSVLDDYEPHPLSFAPTHWMPVPQPLKETKR